MDDWEKDAELVERALRGDPAAKREIYRRYGPRVVVFFRNKARPEDTDDLVQRVFLALFEGLARIERGRKLCAYIMQTARNILCNYLGRESRRHEPINPEVECVEELIPGAGTLFSRKRQHVLLLRALRSLSIDTQILLERHLFEETTLVELAAEHEITDSAMRSRYARARKLLNSRVSELGESAALIESTLDNIDRWVADIREYRGLRPSGVDPSSSDGHE